MGRRPVQRDRQDVQLDRFVDEVVRAGANRRDGRVQAAEPRQHDDRHVRSIRRVPLAQLDAADAAHVEVRHHHVEVLGGHELERVRGRRPPRDLAPALAQADGEGLAERLVVVDDQYARRHATSRTGKKTENVVPARNVLSTAIQPPCSRMIP